MHNADEDAGTLAAYGGYWVYGDAVGVTCRRTTDPLNIIYANVASMCRHSRIMFIDIRITMMATKN